MASTALVELAGVGNRARELAQYAADAAYSGQQSEQTQFLNECRDYVSKGDFASFVGLILKLDQKLFSVSSDEAVEGAFILIMAQIRSFEPNTQMKLEDQLVTCISASSERSQLRLKLLANLYNLLDFRTHTDYKLRVFLATVDYASRTNYLEMLQPYLADTETWITTWGLSVAQQRQLYSRIASALDVAGKADEAQAFRIRYLTTFENTSDDLTDARAYAREAAIGYIKAPVVSQQSNLPSLRAVKALENGSSEDKLVFHLLQIFAGGSLADYEKFHGDHHDFQAKLGVDHAASLATIRLLSLCSLAASQQTLTYDDIMQALNVDKNEVESWVVNGVSRGLLEATIDETTETVTITRTTHRHFNQEHWKALQIKLRAWKDNVSSLLSTVRSTRGGVDM